MYISHPLTPSAGFSISVNDTAIPDHGYVEIGDIGFTDKTALHCNTNYFNPYSRGDWIAPDGTRVSSGTVPGFRTTSSSVLVRLLRDSGTPQEGIYQCVVENDTATLQTVHIGLYNSGEGIA